MLVSPEEQHAAVAVVRRDIGQLLPQIPYMFQQAIADKVNSDEGKAIIIKMVNDALDAAEKVRNPT
jgi:hypothetical protein